MSRVYVLYFADVLTRWVSIT